MNELTLKSKKNFNKEGNTTSSRSKTYNFKKDDGKRSKYRKRATETP